MSIPTHLEKLIWDGKARYQHAVVGGSTTSVIPVPNDAITIIYEIVVFNFIDELPGDIDSQFQRTLNQMELREVSKNSGTHFMLRSDTKEVEGLVQQNVIPQGHVTFNPYLIFTEDIIVNFIRNPSLPWSIVSERTTDIGLNALGAPIGPAPNKGQGMFDNVTVIEYGDALDSASVPPSTKYKVSGKAGSFNGMRLPYVDETELQASFGGLPANANSLGTLPIANVSYVQIDQGIPDNMKKT